MVRSGEAQFYMKECIKAWLGLGPQYQRSGTVSDYHACWEQRRQPPPPPRHNHCRRGNTTFCTILAANSLRIIILLFGRFLENCKYFVIPKLETSVNRESEQIYLMIHENKVEPPLSDPFTLFCLPFVNYLSLFIIFFPLSYFLSIYFITAIINFHVLIYLCPVKMSGHVYNSKSSLYKLYFK